MSTAPRWSSLLLGAALLVGACSSGSSNANLRPHPLQGAVTSVVDYSGVALPRVPGNTTTTVREQGTASIVGSVSGPSGLVPGATVRIEHLLGNGPVRHDVIVGPDGKFSLPNIPGGRYRVRAFLAPTLALLTPDIRFLPDGQPATFDLTMQDERQVVARAAVAPGAPFVGDDVNVAIVVANHTVDSDGIVQSVPLPGLRVELTGLGAYQLVSPDQGGGLLVPSTTTTQGFAPSTVAVTDANGQVQYAMRCVATGTPTLALLVTVTVRPAQVAGQPPVAPTEQVQQEALNVPACIDPSTITTPTTTGSTTQGTGTTVPRSTTTTTGGRR